MTKAAGTVKVRLNLYLPSDLNEKIEEYGKKFDIPKSLLIQMSVRAGLDSIIRAISPVDAFSPEQLAAIAAAAAVRTVNEEKETAGETGRG